MFLKLVHYRQKKIFLKSRDIQREDSPREVSNIPKLSTGSTLRFKSRRRQSSISSITDVFACEAANEGRSDLSVSGMKRRSGKNREGDEERDAEAGAANVTPTNPFEEGEQTLIRPEHHLRSKIDRVEEMAQKGQEKLRDELTDVKSQKEVIRPSSMPGGKLGAGHHGVTRKSC